MTQAAAYTIRDLSFSYRAGRDTLRSVQLCLAEDETVGLSGPNGGGKTTLGKILAGILKPKEGRVTLFDEDMSHLTLPEIGRLVGYCFQNPNQQLFSVSVEQELGLGMHFQGIANEKIRDRIDPLARELGIEHLYDRFPLSLSWGEKRRVALAACLALEPRFLILDEPTAGLDEARIESLNNILKKLRERRIGMLLISHNQEFLAANAARFLKLENGRVIDGTV